MHPLEVGSLLLEVGASDDVIAGGVLHDTIEKTDADAAELRSRFGSHVARLVVAVTEDERILGYAARKAALRRQAAQGGDEALMVFAADKISKARELRLQPPASDAVHPPIRDRRIVHYRRCLELLEDRLADSPLVAQFRDELGRDAIPAHKQLVA